jgi:ABC-type transport system involved in multi-copper enzyme maturation permease subunit
MSQTAEIGLTAARELRKNLRSVKGIAMFVLFVLGGLVPRLIAITLERWARGPGGEARANDEMIRFAKMEYLTHEYGKPLAEYLADCPAMLLGLFQGTLMFLPLVVLMVAFDVVAGETQHRTFRYLVVRATKTSLLVGKGLGIWAVACVMTLVLHSMTWILSIVHGKDSFGTILAWGTRLWLYSAIYSAAYVGLATLLSSLFKTPVVALFVGVGTVFGMAITRLAFAYYEKLEPLTWAFPASYEPWLLSNDPARVVSAMAVLLAWGAVCLFVASEILRRRDV